MLNFKQILNWTLLNPDMYFNWRVTLRAALQSKFILQISNVLNGDTDVFLNYLGDSTNPLVAFQYKNLLAGNRVNHQLTGYQTVQF